MHIALLHDSSSSLNSILFKAPIAFLSTLACNSRSYIRFRVFICKNCYYCVIPISILACSEYKFQVRYVNPAPQYTISWLANWFWLDALSFKC